MFRYGPLVARTLLVLVFVISGLGILADFGGTVGFYTAVGVPVATVAVVLALIAKLGGSAMVITGVHARTGALALIVFTLLATLIAHRGMPELINALKNLSIVGGLLMIVMHGPGPMNLAHKCPCPKCKGMAHHKAGPAGGVCNCGNCDECRRAKSDSGMM